MNILLVGYGRMGQLVGQLAESYDCKVAGIVDPASASSSGTIDHPRWRDAVDVAIEATRLGGGRIHGCLIF